MVSYAHDPGSSDVNSGGSGAVGCFVGMSYVGLGKQNEKDYGTLFSQTVRTIKRLLSQIVVIVKKEIAPESDFHFPQEKFVYLQGFKIIIEHSFLLFGLKLQRDHNSFYWQMSP